MQMDRRRYNGIEVEVLDYSSVRPGEKSRRLGRTALGIVLAGYIAYVIVIVIAIAHGGDYAVGGFDWLIPSCLYSVFGAGFVCSTFAVTRRRSRTGEAWVAFTLSGLVWAVFIFAMMAKV
jgi:hypothetical protein